MLPAKDYFTLLNLPHTFFIDKQTLKHNYYTQAKRYHPSMTGGNDNMFVGLKKAYDTLNNDLKRALYMHNSVHPAGARSALDADAADLSHVYELSERLSANDKNAQAELAERIDECKRFYYDPVYLGRWRYYERMRERMKDKEIDMRMLLL
ncbi:putative Heat shock protein DnaJ [Trachipleistophora hominis]|uniref:Putative Heat shock protein DnaJ n=1 Tax=Trachipleistophora hominis TaxID=72359 RepID=L7JUG9_TRAHO|nr:putative Heat shock protein DnaJ [Trachipleistophora hominis]